MKRTMKLASRSKRFAAGVIDTAIPMIAYVIMTNILGIPIQSAWNGYGYGYNYNYNFDYDIPMTRGAAMGMLFATLLLLAYLVAQFVLFARAQSIGKAVLGLQVVSSINGKPFGFWKMMLRECVVKSASSGVLMLGYIWILLDERNRSWHDKILDSYVVDLKETANMYVRAAASAEANVLEREEFYSERHENAVVEERPAEPAEAPVVVEEKPVVTPVAEEKPAAPAPVVVEEIKAPEEHEEPVQVTLDVEDAQSDDKLEKDDVE